MLQWDSLHPYNAVHVVRIPGPLDPERLEQVIQRALGESRLRGLTLDARRVSLRWDGDPAAIELKSLAAANPPEPGLGREIERQLNTPFSIAGRFVPFRFFILPADTDFFLGVAYFHAVADAESVVRLMRHLAAGWLDRSGCGSTSGRGPSPEGCDRVPPAGLLLQTRRLGAFARRLRALRRSCRPPCRDIQDLSNRLVLVSLGAGELQTLRTVSKAWEVTLNDLWLALLLQSAATLAQGRREAARRNKLSVGCIVNTRRELGASAEDAFGLFLGSFIVTHDMPAGISLGDLARQVREQTRRIKQQRLYLGGAWELALARGLVSWFSPKRRRHFYLKHHPLWGGITNMDLNKLWDPAGPAGPVDYFRAVSTGPAVPLVLSVTTAGQKVNLSFTYRPSVFESAEVERLARDFIAPLRAAGEAI